MAGEVYSGRFGSITGCGQVSQWSLEVNITDDAQSNSATRGAKMRDAGIRDWTGSCSFLGNTFPGQFGWGSSQEITLKTGGPQWGQGGRSFTGDMVWTSAAISGDFSSGGRVQCSLSFAGDGPLTPSEGGSNEDASPVIMLAKDCKIKWNDQEVAWKSFSFTVNHEAQEYLDSTCYISEGALSGQVWKKRMPGIIDCTGTIDYVGDQDIATMDDLQELKIVHKSGNSETVLLKMKYARYMGTGGITVDPSSGSLIGGQGKFNMAAHNDAGTIGSLTLYGTELFPPGNNNNA